MLPYRCLIAAILFQAIAVIPAAAEKRVAFVAGNAAYAQAGTLTNPVNDASDIARALTQSGFEVILGVNLDRRTFEEKLRAFSRSLEDADTAVVFYAGHGLQVAGRNYLVPVDASLKTERDLDFETIGLDFILRQMEAGRDGKTSIVFLDACRDNPLARNLARSMGTRSASVGSGLAEVQTGVGTFIAFSTQPGNVALDGAGRNSPFTAALSNRIKEPGKNLTALMIEVRKDVLKATSGRQVPWDHSALTADFFFLPVASQPDQVSQLPEAGGSLRRTNTAGTGASPEQIVAELDALAAARNWRELSDRLTDVSPTARNSHWEALAEQAAAGELTPLTAPGGSAAERLNAIERYSTKFPSLANSAKFLSLRTRVGLDGFAHCFDERQDNLKCLSDLERFIHTAPVSTELALGAAHLVGVNVNHQYTMVFYEAGLDAPGGEAVCTDPKLEYDLISALSLPPNYRWAKAAKGIAERCWSSVKTFVAANIAREVGETYYLQNTCAILIQHRALTGLREKRCQAALKKQESSQ
jgi:uncharacterized caspase-like protein